MRGLELDWFTNLRQFVFTNGKCSSMQCIKIGVPQGSILGPLLFLIYINDLPLSNEMSNSLFADDTMLLDSHDDLPLLVTKINREFQKVINYFNFNRLSLHKEKTKFMIFFKKQNSPTPNVVFNYNEPGTPDDLNLISPMKCVNNEQEQKIKFLGVFIDPHLTFRDHIKYVNQKLATGLFFLRSVKHILNEKSLKYLYYALIHCNIIYAIHIYSSATENLMKSILLKRKNAVRIISNSKYNAHTEPLFKNLRIIPFTDLIEFFKVQFMHSFKNDFLPSSFQNTWVTNRIRRDGQAEIELRNDDLLAIPFARILSRLPLTSFPKIWETFPNDEIKFVRNKIEFNSKLKDHYLNKFNSVPVVTGYFVPPVIFNPYFTVLFSYSIYYYFIDLFVYLFIYLSIYIFFCLVIYLFLLHFYLFYYYLFIYLLIYLNITL